MAREIDVARSWAACLGQDIRVEHRARSVTSQTPRRSCAADLLDDGGDTLADASASFEIRCSAENSYAIGLAELAERIVAGDHPSSLGRDFRHRLLHLLLERVSSVHLRNAML